MWQRNAVVSNSVARSVVVRSSMEMNAVGRSTAVREAVVGVCSV